jgi:hypothetical protein
MSDFLVISENEYIGEIKPDEYKVLSIDIGVIHFGISQSIVNKDYTLKEVIWVDNINITNYKHSKCKYSECKLHHTKTFCDWIEHLIQEHIDYFESSDIILLEKQPPAGFVVIEQLIYSKYRYKTYLISPNSVHKYLNFKGLDYEMRKKLSEKIADRVLSEELINKTKKYDRRHDISDTICMLLYFLSKKREEYQKQERIKRLESLKHMDGLSVIEKLERFRYVARK